MIKRYCLLLIASALIGSLSAIAYPLSYPMPVILRGITLSLCLTIGTIIVNYLNRDNLDNQTKPSIIRSAITGIGLGLIAGLIMTLPEFEIKPMVYVSLGEDDKSLYYSWAGIVICAFYGIAIHTAYALRWRFKNKVIASLICIVIASGITGLVRLYMMGLPASGHILSVNSLLNLGGEYTITQFLTTSLPFCLLWLLIHAACDPAWSFKRWKETISRTISKDYLLIISSIIYPMWIVCLHYLNKSSRTITSYEISIYVIMLTGFLTLGTIAINRLTQKSLNRQITPSWLIGVLVGGVCALLFNSILIGVNLSLPNKQIRFISPFYIDIKYVTFYIAAYFLFGLVVHTAYCLRWVTRNPFFHFMVMVIASVICYAVMPILLITNNEHMNTNDSFIPAISVIIWYIIHRISDPAWSLERWQKVIE